MLSFVVPRGPRGFFAGIVPIAAAAGLALPMMAAPIQQAYLKASNGGVFDQFGHAVAVSGNTMVIGAHYEAGSAAGVNGNQNDNGAPNAGAAYVFVRSGTNWTQQAYLKASNPDANDFFGTSVAVSGDTIVVGAREESSAAQEVNGNQEDNGLPGAGAAYVFVRSGTNWTQQAYLKPAKPGTLNYFGASVAVSGNTVVVGAPNEPGASAGVNGDPYDDSLPSAGAAYVFVRNGTNWTPEAYLKASNPRMDTLFGHSVALSGETVVVGAPFEDGTATGINQPPASVDGFEAGAAYVFARAGTNWSQQAYLKASNAGASDNFGWSVAASADTVAVGAFQESSSATGVNGAQGNDNAARSGAAYVFVRSGNTWSQQAYIKASNTEAEDRFGWSIGVANDNLVVGAPHESSGSRTVNGNQSDNSASSAGAAYVFTRTGATWAQAAYLKASNADGGSPFGDYFGVAVAVSEDTVAVGARLESSNATGVNGAQNNNFAPYSGAAYVFTDFVARPTLVLTRNGTGGYFIRFTGVPDRRYELRRSGDILGPWSPLGTMTAPPSGQVEFLDAVPPAGRGFYRAVQLP